MIQTQIIDKPRFGGTYFLSPDLIEQRGQKSYDRMKAIFEKRKGDYPDSIHISVYPQNGFYKEGLIQTVGKPLKESHSKEISLRKLPIPFTGWVLPVSVGPPLESGPHFVKRLIQEAQKLAKAWYAKE